MLESTLRDRARTLLTASGRSDVPPFMVMDVMAAAARIEAAGGHVIHMEVGQPAAPAPKTALAAARAALDDGRIDYTSALGIPSLRARIATHYRDTYGCSVDPERIVVTTGSSQSRQRRSSKADGRERLVPDSPQAGQWNTVSTNPAASSASMRPA